MSKLWVLLFTTTALPLDVKTQETTYSVTHDIIITHRAFCKCCCTHHFCA